jgi:hypothetical protein
VLTFPDFLGFAATGGSVFTIVSLSLVPGVELFADFSSLQPIKNKADKKITRELLIKVVNPLEFITLKF